MTTSTAVRQLELTGAPDTGYVCIPRFGAASDRPDSAHPVEKVDAAGAAYVDCIAPSAAACFNDATNPALAGFPT